MFIRVGADTTGLQRGMRDAQNRVQSFGRATNSLNFDRLRGPLTSLGAQITGLNPAFSTLTSTLLSMTAGGGVAVAAIAGFTAIGAAMRKMGEDARQADKAVEDAIKRLDDLASKGAAGGNLSVFKDFTEAQTRRGELDREAEPLRASVAAREAMGALGNVFGMLDKERRQLALLEAEIAKLDRAIEAATKVLRGTPQAIDGITVSAERLKRASLSDFAGPGLPVVGETARAALAAGKAPVQPEWVRRALALNLQRIVPDRTGQGGGATDNAVRDFREAVDSFGKGVHDVVSGAFSAKGLENIGANLASQGIGFLAGKLFEGIGSLFGGVSTAMSKLALAMEQNTRALRASSDFLAKRLSGAGLTDDASKIGEVLRGVLDRAAISPDGRINLTEFREAMKQAGVSMETFAAVAKLLGINIETLSIETLEQFWESIDRATAGLGGFSDQINEALRNFPTLFNPNLARFRAGGLTAPTSGGIGNRIDPITAAAVQINGPITVVASDPEVFVSKLRQRARRGGPSAVRMAY